MTLLLYLLNRKVEKEYKTLPSVTVSFNNRKHSSGPQQ